MKKEAFDFSAVRDLRKQRGLTMADVAERSGVSIAVLSKLERNQTRAELDTLYRISRVFGLTVADLISLAENRSSQVTVAEKYSVHGFDMQRIRFSNITCMRTTASVGSALSRPEVHGDDYEVCFVEKGSIELSLPHEKHRLNAGEAIQFDAAFMHRYEVVESCELAILHIPKRKRF